MNRSAAEEHLRVIRELMERATVYRAVSAPAALFCGLIALSVSGLALIPGRFSPCASITLSSPGSWSVS